MYFLCRNNRGEGQVSEIKRKPIKLEEKQNYVASAGDVVFSEQHTIADIIRYAISCSGVEDVEYVVSEEKDK
jgi:hypothetical protein